MMEQERLPMIQEITACVCFRQENDIIVTCQHRTILEQDILSENFYPLPVTERSLLEAKVPAVKRRTSCVYADLRKLSSEMNLRAA